MSRLTFDFGPRGARDGRQIEPESTRILVIADLHGSAKDAAKGAAGLDTARIVGMSVDNFEDVMRRVQPRVSLMAGGAERTLTFESIQDFHPDELYTGIELFARSGSGTRSATVKAARDVAAPAEDDASTLERLLGTRPVSKPAPALAPQQRNALDQLLRELVAPHIIPAPPPPKAAADDDAISDMMRAVLHAPEFQAVEATWRALRWLVYESPLGGALEVSVLDASRADLIADLRACGAELERSQLYRLVVQQQTSGPGARPFSLVVGDLTFAGSEEDVSLLAGLGAVAAQAGGCLIAAAEPALWGCRDLARNPERGYWSNPEGEVAARLALLRASAVAPFIGLCAPRVLGRVPYGKRSDPVDRFDFTELAADPPHTDFLWINGAFAAVQLILAAVAERGWDEGPGSVLELGDLPHAVYRFAGGDAIKPCAEVYLDESSAEQVLAAGVMPFMSHRSRNAVRLLRLQSIARPPARLAFRSAAVS